MQFKFFRKSENCLNCGHPLLENHNFCPRCGQKNTHGIVSLDEFLKDVVATIFNFDSRWARTFKPFFTKPGELTNAFIKGRRMEYTDPLRLYFLASLIFFVSLSTFIVEPLGNVLNKYRNEFEQKKSFIVLDGDSGVQINGDTIAELQKQFDKVTSNSAVFEDSVKNAKFKANMEKTKNNANSFKVNSDKGVLDFLKKIEDRSLSAEQLRDSLSSEKGSPDNSSFFQTSFGLFTVRKLQKIGRNDFVNFIAKYVDWISFFIISLLPLFAGVLSILNLRLKRFYVENLVFTIHTQAYAYVFLGICLIIFGITHWWWIFLAAFAVSYFYAVAAFKNVYGQNWFKSGVKVTLLGGFYFFVLLIGLPLHGLLVFLIY